MGYEGLGDERRSEWESPGHDSSIRTSTVGMSVGLGPRSRATASPPSTFARAYKASRASSSGVRFARERRASASYQQMREKDNNGKGKRAHQRLHIRERRRSLCAIKEGYGCRGTR